MGTYPNSSKYRSKGGLSIFIQDIVSDAVMPLMRTRLMFETVIDVLTTIGRHHIPWQYDMLT